MNADPTDRSVSLMLEEYKSLQAQMAAALQAQRSSLFSGASLAAVLLGGLNVWDKPFVAWVVFVALVPLLGAFVLMAWIDEALRALGAARYLAYVEARLNQLVAAPDAFTWERQLHIRPSWFSWITYDRLAVVLAITTIVFASILLSDYRGTHLTDDEQAAFPLSSTTVHTATALSAILAAGLFLFILRALIRSERLRAG
jgi:hypothetical protein